MAFEFPERIANLKAQMLGASGIHVGIKIGLRFGGTETLIDLRFVSEIFQNFNQFALPRIVL